MSKHLYLIDDLGDAPDTHLEFIDQDDLDLLEENGAEIVSMVRKTIKGVECQKVEINTGRELSTMGQSNTHELATLVADGIKKGLSLAIPDTSSHLGAPADTTGIPGLQVISGSTAGKMYDAGLIAASQGKTIDDCPCDTNTEAGMQWLKGFYAAESIDVDSTNYSKEAKDTARSEGNAAAVNAKEHEDANDPIEVHCPYRGVLRQCWIEGFESGGGTVE